MDDQTEASDGKTDTRSEAATTNGAPTTAARSGEPVRAEVSAQTIGRMMGLATMSDLKLLDSKLDLVSTKVTGLVVKLDKVLTTLSSMPTAADLERVEVQLGGVKTALKESVNAIQDIVSTQKK